MRIRAAARRGAHPEGESVGSIGGDGGNTGKQERGERDETSATGNGIDSPAKGAGEKEEDGVVEVQTEVLPRMPFLLQSVRFQGRLARSE